MATLNYLWNNRIKYPFLSRRFIKSWIKRIVSLPSVLNRNINRCMLIRKGAKIAETAEINDAQINGKKINLVVGEFSFIGKVELALHTTISIGSYVCMNDGVKVLSASHNINDPNWKHKKAAIIIKDYAWIATNAILLPGVTIGRGAVVGAGAVISKDVPDYGIAVGNPSQVLAKKRTEDLRYNPCEFLKSNRSWLYRDI